MCSLADFVLYLVDEQQEDYLWDIWLHKPIKDSFEQFKRKHMRKMYKEKVKTISKEEEESLVKRATQFIKPRSERW
jgi:hypothetical protein